MKNIPEHIKLTRIFKEEKPLNAHLDTSLLRFNDHVDYSLIRKRENEKNQMLELENPQLSIFERSRLNLGIILEDKHLKNKQRAEEQLILKKKKTMRVIKKKGKSYLQINHPFNHLRCEVFIQSYYGLVSDAGLFNQNQEPIQLYFSERVARAKPQSVNFIHLNHILIYLSKLRRMQAKNLDDLSSIADSDNTLMSRLKEKEQSNPFEFLQNRTKHRKHLLHNQQSIVLDEKWDEDEQKGKFDSYKKVPTIEEDLDLVNLMGNIPIQPRHDPMHYPINFFNKFTRRRTMDLSVIKEPSFMVESKTNLDNLESSERLERKGSLYMSKNKTQLFGIPERRIFEKSQNTSAFQKEFSHKRMKKLVKMAKKLKRNRRKKEKKRLNKFKKRFGKAFVTIFSQGGNPIYFDEQSNCPKLNRSISISGPHSSHKPRKKKKKKHQKKLEVNKLESGEKKNVLLELDSFDSLFSDNDSSKESGSNSDSASISEILNQKEKVKVGSSQIITNTVQKMNLNESKNNKNPKFANKKSITIQIKKSKRNKSVGFTSPESSIKYVERIWSPHSYKANQPKNFLSHYLTENQPRMFRPHTAKARRREISLKISSKAPHYNLLSQKSQKSQKLDSISVNQNKMKDLDSVINQSIMKKSLLQGRNSKSKIIVSRKKPTDKDIHYPGALTKKLKLCKSVNFKSPKSNSTFKTLLKNSNQKDSGSGKFILQSKKGCIYSSSISLLNIRKKHGFFRDSGFDCEGIYH